MSARDELEVDESRYLPPNRARRMMAVGFATIAAVVAYWAVILAVASISEAGIGAMTGGAVAAGFFLMPMAFLILAWLSRHDSVVKVSALASALALVVWTWVPFIVGEPITPFAAALGLGGAFALRFDDKRMSYRLIAVAVVTVYVFVVVRAAFGLALLVTPFLPLTALLAADYVKERIA